MTTQAFLEDLRTDGGEPVQAEVTAHGSKLHITFKPYGRRGNATGMRLIIDMAAVMHAQMDDGK